MEGPLKISIAEGLPSLKYLKWNEIMVLVIESKNSEEKLNIEKTYGTLLTGMGLIL